MKRTCLYSMGIGALALALVFGQTLPSHGQTAGKSGRAYLGVLAQPGNADDKPGVVLRDVQADSPAGKAGLKDGDRLIGLDDKEIKDWSALSEAVRGHKPGDKVTVKVMRNDKEMDLNVTLGERQETAVAPVPGEFFAVNPSRAYLGIHMQQLTPELRKHLDLTAEKGIVVTDVTPNSPAAKAGLKNDDIITQANGQAMSRPEELRDLISGLEAGKELALHVYRGKEQMEVKVKLEKAPAGLGMNPQRFEGRFENLPPEVRKQLERMVPLDRGFNVTVPPIFNSMERVPEMEKKIQDLEKRIKELEEKLNKK